MATKVAVIVEAARKIERNQDGFTAVDIQDVLGWSLNEKLYIQNTLSYLAKRSKVHRISRQRPVRYSFKDPGTGTKVMRDGKPKGKPKTKPKPVPSIEPDKERRSITIENPNDLSELDLSLKCVGDAIHSCLNAQAVTIIGLENEVQTLKTHLANARKRVADQSKQLQQQKERIHQLSGGSNNTRQDLVSQKVCKLRKRAG